MKVALETSGVPGLPYTFVSSKLAFYKTDYHIYVVWYRTSTATDPGAPKGGPSAPVLITNLDGTTCSVTFTTTFSSAANNVEEIVIPLSCKSIQFSGATYAGSFGDFSGGVGG